MTDSRDAERGEHPHTRRRAVGAAAGSVGGMVAGAGIGILTGGPIGSIIGALAGAVGGGWAGLAAGEGVRRYAGRRVRREGALVMGIAGGELAGKLDSNNLLGLLQ